MNKEEREHHFFRGLYMVLFWIFLRVSLLITALIAIVQWAVLWFQDEPIEPLMNFGQDLSIYQQQILQYLTFQTEEKVFPFRDWPEAGKAHAETE